MGGETQKISQDHLEQLTELGQAVEQVQRQFDATQAAFQLFLQFLGRKYGLKEGDGIAPDGTVILASQSDGEANG